MKKEINIDGNIYRLVEEKKPLTYEEHMQNKYAELVEDKWMTSGWEGVIFKTAMEEAEKYFNK